jgi:hypothetical protein
MWVGSIVSKTSFVTHELDSHVREEESQWATLLGQGNSAKGMALLYLQKLCTAFHELAPAFAAGALREQYLEFFRERMLVRIQRVLELCRDNGFNDLDGVAELRRVKASVEVAATLTEVADLAEPIHQINHTLCEALAAH